MKKDLYFTITATSLFHGHKPYKIGKIVKLVKEPDNSYDEEAIKVVMRYVGPAGYVANSTNTVAKGTMSGGRLYDRILDEDYATIKFITKDSIIAKILTNEEIEEEKNNPESDIHQI